MKPQLIRSELCNLNKLPSNKWKKATTSLPTLKKKRPKNPTDNCMDSVTCIGHLIYLYLLNTESKEYSDDDRDRENLI